MKYLLPIALILLGGYFYFSQTETLLGDASGANSPGTMADDATVGDTAWINPTNIASSNDSYATASNEGGTTHYLKATNFGFSIPAGATINGILVEVESKVLLGTPTAHLRIVKGGSISTTDKTSSLSTTEQYRSTGASDDLWGETWTADDINASTFGVVFGNINSAGNFLDSVDHIRITVTYTPAASSVPQTQTRSGTVNIKSGSQIIK